MKFAGGAVAKRYAIDCIFAAGSENGMTRRCEAHVGGAIDDAVFRHICLRLRELVLRALAPSAERARFDRLAPEQCVAGAAWAAVMRCNDSDVRGRAVFDSDVFEIQGRFVTISSSMFV